VGSSCSVRGSDELAEELEKLIDREQVRDRVELVGSFCMNECSKGISVQVDEVLFRELHPQDAESLFYHQVMPRLTTEVP
jgi:NADH:ubiquinone oxidoreductase subunit E